ncbi:MAG: twin-arginine translocase subunit TatC, partial [Planctomycetes bacterium]|nr:twin-arginine translocase subunit TatC [Planctomycetota bacterium]
MADNIPAHSDSTSDDGDPVETGRMSIGDHLDELRSCIVRALVGVALGAVVGFVFGKEILGIICRPLLVVQFANGLQPGAQVLSPSTAFLAYLKISLLSGLIIASPWVIYQIWRFVASGLYGNEKRFASAMLLPAIGLFAAGVAFLYFIVLPIVLNFFIVFNKNFELPSLTPTAFQRLLLPDDSDKPVDEAQVETLALPLLTENPKEPPPGQAWINTTSRRLVVSTSDGLLSSPMEVGATASTLQSHFALD